MGSLTHNDIVQARQMDLLTYLRSSEPSELVHVSGETYALRSHDSLRISNGMWYWFSHGIGGKSALDYLIKVQGYSFPRAVRAVLNLPEIDIPVAPPPPPRPKSLLMPELNETTDAAASYLKSRGIHSVILDYCLRHRLILETKKYHNVLFVGCDSQGVPRQASLRGTQGTYKGEATGSDKHFGFCIPAREGTGDVHIFESAVDLLSYATLELFEGRDWQRDHLLSLSGVYATQRRGAVPIGLDRFLGEHPEVDTVHLHLDNDDTGRRATESIAAGLAGRCSVLDEPPTFGKDVNDQLRHRIGRTKELER